MAISLTLTRTDLTTAAPGTATNLYESTDANIATHKNRIGEYKFHRFYFTASKVIDNFFIWFNPAMFMQKGASVGLSGIPVNSYSCLIAPGGAYGALMAYNGAGPNPLTEKVDYVLFSKVTTTTFIITVAYYLGFDAEGYLDPSTGDNHGRLLKDRKSNSVELDASVGSSVYNDTNVDFRAYVYMQKNTVPSDNGFKDVNPQWGYKAGFYNKGTHNAATYFTNPQWNLPGPDLSAVADTSIGFKIDVPGLLDARVIVISMIRTDKFDNTVDWKTNYEFEQALCDVGTPAGTKMKNFFGPPVFIGGSTYAVSFDTDYTALVLGAKYRFIAHVYHSDFPTNFEVDAFISPEYNVSADVPYTGNGFTFTTLIDDIRTRWTGNQLDCCIEERMRLLLQADYSANKWKNDILARLGLTVTNDPRRYLTKVQLKMYTLDPINPYLHIVDLQSRTKTGPTSYTFVKRGINMSFGTDSFEFYYDFRNRYEADQANIDSVNYVSNVSLGPLSTQYWGGQYIWCEWTLTFFYDDYITPFYDVILLNQAINVRDYDDGTILDLQAQNPPFDDKAFWCPDDDMCLEGVLVGAPLLGDGGNLFLFATIEPTPGAYLAIEEAENIQLSPLFGQLTTAKIYDEETQYDDSEVNKGKFCVDVSQLNLPGEYKITVFAKHF